MVPLRCGIGPNVGGVPSPRIDPAGWGRAFAGYGAASTPPTMGSVRRDFQTFAHSTAGGSGVGAASTTSAMPAITMALAA